MTVSHSTKVRSGNSHTPGQTIKPPNSARQAPIRRPVAAIQPPDRRPCSRPDRHPNPLKYSSASTTRINCPLFCQVFPTALPGYDLTRHAKSVLCITTPRKIRAHQMNAAFHTIPPPPLRCPAEYVLLPLTTTPICTLPNNMQ